MDSSERIARARAIGSAGEAAELYRAWAEDYDADVYGELEFIGTDRIADLLATHLPDRTTPVIDLGCGTGAAGERLHRDHGFQQIDGVDLSGAMIAVAARKRVYRRLIVADLNDPLPIAAGSYGASVSAGVFTTGHVGAATVPGMLRVLQPGATIAWVVAAPVWSAFEAELSRSGVTTVHAAVEPIRRGGPAEATMFVGVVPGSTA
jgi:trans-aconitate methyltransferase